VDYRQHSDVEDGVIMSFVVSMDEKNDKCFENREKALGSRLSIFFFKIVFLWIATFVAPLVIIMIFLFCFLILTKCFFLHTSYVLVSALHF
jgi:hypothetical protein